MGKIGKKEKEWRLTVSDLQALLRSASWTHYSTSNGRTLNDASGAWSRPNDALSE